MINPSAFIIHRYEIHRYRGAFIIRLLQAVGSFIIHHSLITLLFFTIGNSQSLVLPSLQDLESTLITFIEIERDAKLRSFDELKSASWHDLLPSVGVAYTPTGAPRPSASWSPLQILDRKEKNKKRKLDRQSIILGYEIHLTDRLYKLRQLYHDYGIEYQSIKNQKVLIEIDEKLFDITQKKYDENIIKPSEYLKAKKGDLTDQNEYRRSRTTADEEEE